MTTLERKQFQKSLERNNGYMLVRHANQTAYLLVGAYDLIKELEVNNEATNEELEMLTEILDFFNLPQGMIPGEFILTEELQHGFVNLKEDLLAEAYHYYEKKVQPFFTSLAPEGWRFGKESPNGYTLGYYKKWA